MVESGVVGLETLTAGFREAFGRFISLDTSTARFDPPIERAFIPVFDALNWAVAVDDFLQREQPAAERWWREHLHGEVVRAVRFARNRVHHQWARAVTRAAPGSLAEYDLPIMLDRQRVAVWIWRVKLPEPEQKRYADPDGEQLYGQHLAGQLVRTTLDRLHGVLMAVD